MRDDLRHYVDVAMSNDNPQFELLGDGIQSLEENMNPEEESKHYIHMRNASNSIKSYQRTFDVDKEDCIDDEVQNWIDTLVDELPKGAEAHTSFVRFRLKDAVKDSEGVYRAIRVPCTVSVNSSGGDGGDYVHNSISIKQRSDDIKGTFNIKTNTFTADGTTGDTP